MQAGRGAASILVSVCLCQQFAVRSSLVFVRCSVGCPSAGVLPVSKQVACRRHPVSLAARNDLHANVNAYGVRVSASACGRNVCKKVTFLFVSRQ